MELSLAEAMKLKKKMPGFVFVGTKGETDQLRQLLAAVGLKASISRTVTLCCLRSSISFKVPIIPEDPTNNGYILKPDSPLSCSHRLYKSDRRDRVFSICCSLRQRAISA